MSGFEKLPFLHQGGNMAGPSQPLLVAWLFLFGPQVIGICAGETTIERGTKRPWKKSKWPDSELLGQTAALPPLPQKYLLLGPRKEGKGQLDFFFSVLCRLKELAEREKFATRVSDYINNFPGGLFKMLWGIDCFKAFKKHHLHTINMLIARRFY